MLSQDLQNLSAWLQQVAADELEVTPKQLRAIARGLEGSADMARQLERTCIAQAVRLVEPLAANVLRLPERS
jgi:hypothetical protein